MNMNRTPSSESELANLPPDLARKIMDLQGYFELGMAKEALAVARALLKYRPVYPYAFTEALWPIFVHADHCRTWKRLVESAYAQFSTRNQKALRSNMLQFYVSMRDYESAYRFLSPRPQAVDDLMFSMWTLLNLKKVEQAKPLWRKCRRLLLQTQDRFEFGMLVEALADYHAYIGDLSTAEAYWRLAPPEQPFFESAARGLVEIQAVRGHAYVAAGHAILEKTDAEAGGWLDIVLPGNEKGRLADAYKDLQKYSAALSRIVPEKELWRFGGSKALSGPAAGTVEGH